MSKRLSPADSQALDLLLERPDGHGDTPAVNQVFAPSVRERLEASLDSVETVLSLLDELPASEPSIDLVERTLKHIESSGRQPVNVILPERVPQQAERPHA